ncbi:MAG TPA: flavin reductase family protein [Rhizomicrobium sp.]|nr:flavin reductase family protein [Rhizomicrobium sp.]
MDETTLRGFAVIDPEVLYFGTPVAVVSTLNPDGTTNLAAMSSFWALADRFVLGLTSFGQTGANLARCGECVLNFPSPREWQSVDRLGRTTGRADLADYHRDSGIEFRPDKFAASGFTPLASDIVKPLRVAECPVQIEARLRARHAAHEQPALRYFEVQRLRVHASCEVVEPGTGRVDIHAWSPLFYLFRHYYGKGAFLGRSFRAKY